MQNMNIEFSFRGKSWWKQLWVLLTRGKLYTFLTEENILAIYKQYSDQRDFEEQQRLKNIGKVVASKKH